MKKPLPTCLLAPRRSYPPARGESSGRPRRSRAIRQLALGGMGPMQMTPADFASDLARERKALTTTVSAATIEVE